MVHNLIWGKYLEQKAVEKNLPVSVSSSFLSLSVSKQKLFMESTHHILWEKRKPSAPFTLLEAEEC